MMLSRVAESLYWMSRYMERAEDTARLINVVTLMSLDMPNEAKFGWTSLIRVAGLDEIFYKHYSEANEESVLRFLIRDSNNPSSILACITLARENTRTFREVLPWECWESVNELYLFATKNLARKLSNRRRYEILQGVIGRRQGIIGMLSETMSRDQAFNLLRLGRNIERADMTTRILEISITLIPPRDDIGANQSTALLWTNILKALSAYQMYRRYVGVHADGDKAIDYALKNRDFPRSIFHCLEEIIDVLRQLPHSESLVNSVIETLNYVDHADSKTLSQRGLRTFSKQLQYSLSSLDSSLRRNYFNCVNHMSDQEVAA